MNKASTLNTEHTLRDILNQSRTIAVVGLSPKTHRDSFQVTRYMQAQGYRIVPVNPMVSEVLGEKSWPTLEEAARHETIDLVNCFRNSPDIGPIATDAIHIGAKSLWMQLGIENDEAAARAEAAGLLVVQDRCIMVEHARLLAQGLLARR